MIFKFINSKDASYKEAVNLRIKAFFGSCKEPFDLINDEFEKSGIHLVCLNDKNVIGTGRLNIQNKIGIISQMAIDENHQKKGLGSEILKGLVAYCETHNVSKITLSARESALEFYKKFSFVPVGEKYPSKKTAIIHQKMELLLK